MSREAAARTPRERAEKRVGSTLVKWTLDALIGLGGMAAVYAATHTKNRSRVALKVLHRELAANGDVRERFMREAYVANSVGHPGALQILDDYVSEDDEPFLVMELLDGSSLDGLQQKRGTLPPDEVLRYAEQILDVLAAAHAKGIVHRDIKPQNLFITGDGRIKVLDFGVARILDGAASATVTGSLLGTPAFMPPEQASGRTSAVGAASDLWSVGATMFTLLTGRFVHEAENAQAHTVKAAVMHARSLRALLPSAPSGLANVVDRALEFEIGDRWADARRMQEAVQRARRALVPGLREEFPAITGDDDSADEETHAIQRLDIRAALGTRSPEGRPRPMLAADRAASGGDGEFPTLSPRNVAVPSPNPSARNVGDGVPPLAAARVDAEETDGATTSVVALRKEPVAAGRADSVSSVIVVPPPAFSESRPSRPDLPAPPPLDAPDAAGPLPLGVAATEAATPGHRGTAPVIDRTLPLPSGDDPRAYWPDGSGEAAATAPFPLAPRLAAVTPSSGHGVALAPPAGANSPVAPVPIPTFDLPGPAPSGGYPAPPPEAISVAAQAISQATAAKRGRARLGTLEMAAIAGALAAILIVALLVFRAVFYGDSGSPTNSPASPGSSGPELPPSGGPGLTVAVPSEAPSGAITAAAPSPVAEPSASTASSASPSSLATSSPGKTTTGQPGPASRNPANTRWKPKPK